jgi:hypothetical protein
MKVILLILALGCFGVPAQEVKYSNDFEKAELNSVPKEFLVWEGAFSVKEENGNKFLELPGAPLDTYGVFFGPTEKENIAVAARILGTGKGRRFPTFGVSLNGVGGYKLRVSPGKKAIELYKGDEVKASSPFEWQSGKWANLKLQVVKSGAEWQVQGKVWQEGQNENAGAAISWTDKEEPPPGRPMITASPYAGTPIRFDDLIVSAAK